MRRRQMLWIIPGLGILGAAVWSQTVSNVEQAKYEVITSQGDIEIRLYPPMIVAEAEVTGDRKTAISEGFRIIADYIFGNNISKKNVAMTAPVVQQQSEKIAMTAPVTQEGNQGKWKVRFVMPASYTMETLPKPNNDAVKLVEVPSKRFAVIRFSGMGGEASLRDHADELSNFITGKKLNAMSQPSYAFYNPPWTLPFLRRNEVMIEVTPE
jgi:effector-binding domain-containing protein